ncbi:MAG TPA: gliding motility-associated C-terminal domain-containing protein [Flavobacteriaceae bacterium]|nr:gliding motility-associated C-terminal domain-containing protein [Flavobacteriaceae bacterium]
MKNFTLFCLFIFSLSHTVKAQIVIGKPTLGFTQACASTSFNNYNVSFVFSPATGLGENNQFNIELSDETGSFTNATILYTSSPGSITASPAMLSFSFPEDTAGEAYRIRVKSTSPIATSTPSDAFPAYFKAQDSPFTINNLIANAVFCSGGSYLLTIDNPGGPLNDSPLNYPGLTFDWYKVTGETTSVYVASGESLTVSQSGTYFVETNYGSCTSNSYSNRVTVSEASSEVEITISSSLGNPYCASDGPTLLSAINGDAYQWYKDGEEISGATQQMLETNESGNYYVTVDLGDCVASASIDLETTDFTSSVNLPEGTTALEEDQVIEVIVTTTAVNPVFEWYVNGAVIPGATDNTFEISAQGNYRVIIRQTAGCISSQEFLFNITEAFPDVSKIPNVVSPNGDGINDTWVIPQAYVSGTNAQVTIISAQGKVVLDTKDYQNNWPSYDFEFKTVNAVYYFVIKGQGKVKKGTITVIR